MIWSPDALFYQSRVEQIRGKSKDQALNPSEIVEFNWSTEVWNRGCPVAVLAPGTLIDFGAALREPVGRIHWAGTETSTYWNGYMDGAVRSGERAAREVLAGL